jgi:hypothetical protein
MRLKRKGADRSESTGYQKYQQGEHGRLESSFKCKHRRIGDEIYEFRVDVGVLVMVGVTLLCPEGVLESAENLQISELYTWPADTQDCPQA